MATDVSFIFDDLLWVVAKLLSHSTSNSSQEAASGDPIPDLERRLKDLELSKSHTDASAILRKERAETLISLRKIMTTLKLESEAGGGGASGAELDTLRKENAALKKINAKQQYRIEHLVHSLRFKLEEQ